MTQANVIEGFVLLKNVACLVTLWRCMMLNVISYFCFFTGFTLQFGYGLFFGFWCFHLLHLYLSVAFPFKAKQLLDSSSHRRMIHITEVTIVILVSVIPPIITLTVSQYESNGYYCYPQSPTVLFYGEILPSMLKLCVGVVLIYLSFRLLRKVSLWVLKVFQWALSCLIKI